MRLDTFGNVISDHNMERYRRPLGAPARQRMPIGRALLVLLVFCLGAWGLFCALLGLFLALT